MLDAITTMTAQLLGITDAEVANIRDGLLAEQAAGSRYAATTALEHPEGSTTPLNEAAMRAQNTYAKLRTRVDKEVPGVLALLLATQIAAERRDEAGEARDRHWELEYDRRDTGVHDATRQHFKRLAQHGVHPNNLKQHRNEEVAIFADLTRWKAFDPRFQHPDNPWRDLLEIYATRLVLRPGYGITVTRSTPGIAAAPVRASDPDHYLFAALLASPSSPIANASPVPTIIVAPVGPPPAEGNDEAEVELEPIELVDERLYRDEIVTAVAPAEEVAEQDEVPPPDPYELPTDMPQAEWDAIMETAEKVVAEQSDWDEELLAAIGSAAEVTEEAVIAAVAAAADVPGATPFHYFVDVARTDGVEIGYYAYQAATVRRIAFELATAARLVEPRAAPPDARLGGLISFLSSKATTLEGHGDGRGGKPHG